MMAKDHDGAKLHREDFVIHFYDPLSMGKIIHIIGFLKLLTYHKIYEN